MPDQILNEEEQLLQTSLREFVDREIAPKAKGADQKGEFQWEAWRGMSELGLTGLGVDTNDSIPGPDHEHPLAGVIDNDRSGVVSAVVQGTPFLFA